MAYTYDYPRPAVTVDMVIFTVDEMRLQVLLIERKDATFQGAWALPGGFVRVGDDDQGESIEEAAFRELDEETNLKRSDVFLEQLYTFGAPNRDPRGRVITVAHYALVSSHLLPKIEAGDDAAKAEWFDVEAALREPLAFDHREILKAAIERLRGKIDYDPRIAVGLLRDEFTQAEFRRVHEVVKGVKYDRGNFSKRFRRMVNDGLIVEVPGQRLPPGAGRPAKLYAVQPGGGAA